MAQPEGQRAAKMMSQGNDVFIVQGAGRVAFDVTNGKATGFQLGGGARAVEAVRKITGARCQVSDAREFGFEFHVT